MCPHRPLHTPTASSAWSTIAAPCGWSLAAIRGAHAPSGPRPCRASSCSISTMTASPGWSNIRPKLSRPPTSALRCAGLFARDRTEVQTARHPQATEDGRPDPGPRRHRREPGRSLARPTAADLAVHSHPAEPLPPRSQCHTGRETCPGGQREGPGCPGPSKEGMRRPSPAPAEGATTAYGGDQGRGLFAWLVLPRSGRRRGRYSLGGPSPRGLPSSPVARSTKPPAWCRVGAEARHGEEVCRESLGVPPSSRHLAMPGVRTVPRAED